VRKSFVLAHRIRSHILRWHQTGIVPQRLEFAAQMMRADTGLHPDQARRYVREPCFDLASRPPLPQHDRAAPGRGRRHGTRSCRCRCPSWQRSNLICWTSRYSFVGRPIQALFARWAGARPHHSINGLTACVRSGDIPPERTSVATQRIHRGSGSIVADHPVGDHVAATTFKCRARRSYRTGCWRR